MRSNPTRFYVDTDSADDARREIIAVAERLGVWIGGDALHGPVERAIAHGRAVITAIPGVHIVVTVRS